uniref:Uncharacterized protein n=1 Tax=Anguilla anguilla TaxID=7936 RepID=A0A0E9PUY2_ANGAN
MIAQPFRIMSHFLLFLLFVHFLRFKTQFLYFGLLWFHLPSFYFTSPHLNNV